MVGDLRIYFTRMTAVSSTVFESLRRLDTCSVSNAIERFDVRLRNEGFVAGTVRCRFPQLAPMLGYAVTARVRTSAAPARGRRYFDRMDWWNYVASLRTAGSRSGGSVEVSTLFAPCFGDLRLRAYRRFRQPGGNRRIGFSFRRSGSRRQERRAYCSAGAGDVPDMVRQLQAQENELTRFCRSDAFSMGELSEPMRLVSKETC
jgi:hypothetical protein